MNEFIIPMVFLGLVIIFFTAISYILFKQVLARIKMKKNNVKSSSSQMSSNNKQGAQDAHKHIFEDKEIKLESDQATEPYRFYTEIRSEEATLYLAPRTVLAEKYLIEKVVGQGGFGITYLARDINLNLKLAVKEYFPQGLVSRVPGQSKVVSYTRTSKSQFAFGLERFLNEAKTLARFEHNPNIVSVRDFFKANGTAYMVMSYIDGLTLEEYLHRNGGMISFAKLLYIMTPVMDALRDIHEFGVMHRDVSPDNIFIDNRGRVFLIDFGAARQEMRKISKSLSVILKAGYAPEEQYRSRGEQGSWTDVYAVAATMYRALTGRIPPESLDRLAEDNLVPPSVFGAEIKPDQEQALLKAMAVRVKDRYQTVEEFQRSLNDFKIN